MLKKTWNRFSKFTRRSFLTKAAVLTAGLKLSPLLSGGRLLAGETSEVGLIRTMDRKEAVHRALQLTPLPELAGKKVLIKPNFNTADPAPGSTHNDTLATLIDEIWERGAREVIIGERSSPPVTQEVMREKGIFELAAQKDVRIVNFDLLKEDELVRFQDDRLHWKDGFLVPKVLYDVDHIIAAGCLKTHQFNGVFTMALKLGVGIIPREGTTYMRELHGSRDMRKMIAEINLAYRPDLFIIDGVEAFTSGGPATGKRVNAGTTLCSRDPVAIDAVGVSMLKHLGSTPDIMNIPVFQQEQIARAAEIGLGASGPEQIRLVTDEPAKKSLIQELETILRA